MKKSTIIRTILLAIVIINLIATKITGKNILNISETQVTEFVDMAISVIVIVASWWKNNSFTKKAILSDEVLDGLRQLDTDDVEEDAGDVE